MDARYTPKELIRTALHQGDIFPLAREWDWPESRKRKDALRQALLALDAGDKYKLIAFAREHDTSSAKKPAEGLEDMLEGGQVGGLSALEEEVEMRSNKTCVRTASGKVACGVEVQGGKGKLRGLGAEVYGAKHRYRAGDEVVVKYGTAQGQRGVVVASRERLMPDRNRPGMWPVVEVEVDLHDGGSVVVDQRGVRPA